MATLQINAGNWQEVPGGGTTNAALATAVVTAGNPALANNPYVNELFLFAKGINVPSEYVNSRYLDGNNQNWTGWSQVPPGGTTNVAMAANYDAHDSSDFGKQHGPALRLLAKGGADNRIYLNVCTFTTFSVRIWSGWTVLPQAFTTLQPVGVSSVSNGDWFVVAQKAADRTLWTIQNPSSPASVWAPIPGEAVTNYAPAVAATQTTVYPNARLFVFHTGDDQHIYYDVYTPDQNTWAGWREVDGGATTNAAIAATAFKDWVIIVAKGINDLHLYYNIYDIPVGNWYGWTLLAGGAQTDAAPAAVAIASHSNLTVFAKGINVPRVYANASVLQVHP